MSARGSFGPARKRLWFSAHGADPITFTGARSERILDRGIVWYRDLRCMKMQYDAAYIPGAGRRRCGVPNRPTLHENDRLLVVAANRSRRQTKHVRCPHALQNRVGGRGTNVVTLIDDDLAVGFDQRLHVAMR